MSTTNSFPRLDLTRLSVVTSSANTGRVTGHIAAIGSAPPPTDGTPPSDANIDDDPSVGLRDEVDTMEEMEAKIKEDAERVRNDVRNLASTIRDINSRFEHVSHLIDAINARLGGRYQTVYDRWDSAWKKFKKLARESRREAIKAAAFMDQYANGILVDVEPDLYPDLRDELQGLLSQLSSEERQQASATATRCWDDIKEDLKLFKEDLKCLIDELQFSGNECHQDVKRLEKEQGDLQQEIALLENKIAECETRRRCSTTITACLGILTIFSVFLCPVVTPYLAVGTVMAGVGTYQAGTARNQARGRLHDTEARLSDAQVREEVAKQDAAAMGTLEQECSEAISSIGIIVTRIDAIAHIWDALEADIGILHEQLSMTLSPDVRITRLFQGKIAATRKLYGSVSSLLCAYAKGVDLDD